MFVRMRLLLILTLLIQHTVFNTVAASVHLSHNLHDGRETPHLHGEQAIADLLSLVTDSTTDELHQHDGNSEIHLHVHLLAPMARCSFTDAPRPISLPAIAANTDPIGLRAPPLLPPPNR